MTWLSGAAQLLWQNALTAVPVVLAVAIVCRVLPLRPATRHSLWLLALIWFVLPAFLPGGTHKEKIRATLAATGREAAGAVASAADAAVSAARPLLMGPFAPDETSQSPFANDTVSVAASSNDSDAVEFDAASDTSEEPEPEFATTAGANDVGEPVHSHSASSLDVAMATDETAAPIEISTLADRPQSDSERDEAEENVPELELIADQSATDSSLANSVISTAPESAASGTSEDAPHPPVAPAISGWTAWKSNVENWVAERRDAVLENLAPWRAWLAQVAVVGAELLRIPPIPTWVWAGGALGLVSLRLIGTLLLMRRVRRGVPAPAGIARQIEEVAASIGLKRAPRTVFVDDNVSPMVSCGLTPTLVLPVRLWRQLDRKGRRAVVYHELAHIRRGDHRVRWLEMLICSLLWWHPLVWWTRKRLGEEAEFACDAWVVWLMPENRRAYAQALLQTKQYLARTHDGLPAAALGMTSGRTQRFARRLTMVMTASNRPRLSLTGMGLACALFATSWLLTPAPASAADDKAAKVLTPSTPVAVRTCTHDGQCTKDCPQKKGAVTYTIATPQPTDVIKPGQAMAPATNGVLTYTAPQGSVVHSTPSFPAGTYVLQPGGTATPLTTSGALTLLEGTASTPVMTLGNGGLWQTQAQSGGGGDDGNMDELRERLNKLEAELQALSKSLGQKAKARSTNRALGGGAGGRGGASAGGGFGGSGGGVARAVPSGAEEVRTYKISNAGKAKALCDLMIRQDVPIRVSPQESGIEVHGTPAQQETFKAFLDMIEGKSGGASGFRMGTGQNLFGAVEKAKVEKSAQAAEELAKVYAERAGKFADAGKEWAKLYAVNGDQYRQQLQELIAAQTAHVTDAAVREKLAEALANVDGSQHSVQEALTRLRSHARASQDQAGELRRQAEALERQAEGMERQMDRLRERAEQLREKADSMKGEKSERSESEADSIQETADAKAAEMDALLAQVDEITTRADQVEGMADVIESTADTIQEFLEQKAEESNATDESDVDSTDSVEAEEASITVPVTTVTAAKCADAPVKTTTAVAPAPVASVGQTAQAAVAPVAVKQR